MTQSDQSQRGLVTVPSLHLDIQQKSHSFVGREDERTVVLAFIEYLQTFPEVLESRDDLYLPFDVGIYYVRHWDLYGSFSILVKFINESLRKKTLVHIGRKLLQLAEVERMIPGLSCYFGMYNLALSLPQMLYDRPGGFLEPLSDEEWQTLTDQAVAKMLKRRQREKYDATINIDEEATNFGYGQLDTPFNRDNPTFFETTKKYSLANDEAKHAAEAIVAAEVVRLRLFLEALQGTLRFIGRLTHLPDYTERQIPLLQNDKERDTKLIDEIISLLHTLLGDETARQDGTQQQEETNVVESEPFQAIEDTEQGIPNDVLAWLLASKKQTVHPSISSFTDTYLKRLVAAGKEKVMIRDDGVTVLPRWKSPEGGSYGYNPTDIAFHLSKLNSLLYEVTHGKQTKDIRLDGETLLAFSTLFGFYNLCSYFLYCEHEYATIITDKISKKLYVSQEEEGQTGTAKWFNEACDLLKPFPGIESWNDEFAFKDWAGWKIRYYSRSDREPPSPDTVYWYEREDRENIEYIPYKFVREEYKRLVALLKSLRILCATLVTYNPSLLNDKEKQEASGQDVLTHPQQEVAKNEATEFMHIEIAGAVITLSKKEAALVAYADAKYKRKKVKVTTAHGMEAVAYLARQIDDDLYAAIFPRLPLQDGVAESVVVQCDNLKLGDDNRLTLFAGNVTEVFLEE